MTSKWLCRAVSACCLALLDSPAALAQTATSEEICTACLVTSLSAHGTHATGMFNDNAETFLWVTGGPAQRLGRSTADTLGVTGGQPAISYDGSKIASTILSNDGTLATSGTWQNGVWTQIVPPLPSDAGAGDSQDSSVWNLSGDGRTVVGLYWRYGQPTGGTANGFVWTAQTNMVGLPTAGGDGRVNGVNANGTVLTGWESDAQTGAWQAAVWVRGVKSIIRSAGNFSMGQATNPKGTVVVGQDWDAKRRVSAATVWTWTGSAWSERVLGVLPGSKGPFVSSLANAVSPDGRLVVGASATQPGPFGSTGFVWTPKGHMQTANAYFAQFGYTSPSGYVISNVLAMSPDGKDFGIVEVQNSPPFAQRSAVIHLN